MWKRLKERYLGPQGLRWTAHNLIGHPLSEIFWLMGMDRASQWVHDVTIPKNHVPGKGRG